MDMKAVSWVGDMYQKFEAMCVEVEDTLHQDTVKYVESQVKTVGACVKRFYSDVMQDLLPLSSDDPVKPENPSLRLVNYAADVVHDMAEVNIKKEPLKASIKKLSEDSYHAHQSRKEVDDRLSANSCNESTLREPPSEESSGVKCRDLHVEQSDSEDLNLGDRDNAEEKFLPSEIFMLKTSLEDGACEARVGKIPKRIDGTNKCFASISMVSNSSHLTAWDELGDDEDMSKLDGTSYETIQAEVDRGCADKEAVRVSELGKMKLDESCVLVDKYESFSPSHLEGKQRSYKKKIKDALYPRSWSRSKKHTHEQLTLEHEDMETRTNPGSRNSVVPASSPGHGNASLPSNDSDDAGWEIV